jgi:hypothetical protein
MAHTEYFEFEYKNYEGKVAMRKVRKAGALLCLIKEPGYGYEPGFFLVGHDLDKDAIRSFALTNMIGSPLKVQGDYLLVAL